MDESSKEILFSFNGYELLSDGIFRRYSGSHGNDTYYDTLGNIHTDILVLKNFIAIAIKSGRSTLQSEFNKLLHN